MPYKTTDLQSSFENTYIHTDQFKKAWSYEKSLKNI